MSGLRHHLQSLFFSTAHLLTWFRLFTCDVSIHSRFPTVDRQWRLLCATSPASAEHATVSGTVAPEGSSSVSRGQGKPGKAPPPVTYRPIPLDDEISIAFAQHMQRLRPAAPRPISIPISLFVISSVSALFPPYFLILPFSLPLLPISLVSSPAIRSVTSVIGTDEWLDDPITRHVIGLRLVSTTPTLPASHLRTHTSTTQAKESLKPRGKGGVEGGKGGRGEEGKGGAAAAGARAVEADEGSRGDALAWKAGGNGGSPTETGTCAAAATSEADPTESRLAKDTPEETPGKTSEQTPETVTDQPAPPASPSTPSSPPPPPPPPSAPTLLWPIIVHPHSKASNVHVLVLPLVAPCHVAAYERLCWQRNCGGGAGLAHGGGGGGGGERGGTAEGGMVGSGGGGTGASGASAFTLSALLADLPAVTAPSSPSSLLILPPPLPCLPPLLSTRLLTLAASPFTPALPSLRAILLAQCIESLISTDSSATPTVPPRTSPLLSAPSAPSPTLPSISLSGGGGGGGGGMGGVGVGVKAGALGTSTIGSSTSTAAAAAAAAAAASGGEMGSGGAGGGKGGAAAGGSGLGFGLLGAIGASMGMSRAKTAQTSQLGSAPGMAGGSGGGDVGRQGGGGGGGVMVQQLKAAELEGIRLLISTYLPFGRPIDFPTPATITTLRTQPAAYSQDLSPYLQPPSPPSASLLSSKTTNQPHPKQQQQQQQAGRADGAEAALKGLGGTLGVSVDSLRDTFRQPVGKPVLYTGKQRVSVAVVEEVSVALYDREGEVADVVSVTGRVTTRWEVEGLPDVTLSLDVPEDACVESLVVHPCAQVMPFAGSHVR
ncbi:unnamed protein product [Closterium sp. NIES-65]|nr:unnamed protein product [Closterium sp. NIES-65]